MNIIFDLDGTISDSSEGIFANFREFFRIYNLPDLPDETLKKFIGPPTEETLSKFLEPEKVPEAVRLYRKIYKEKNILKNRMFDGIDSLMKYLKDKGHTLYVATTKEQKSSEIIIENFGLTKYLSGIYGADIDKNIHTKTDVLNKLFNDTGANKDDSILIGDTLYDVDGAEETGIKVGVALWGFCPKEKIQKPQN